MRSTEKCLQAIAYLEDAEDHELRDAIPGISPGMARAALPFITDAIPKTDAELDEFLTQVGDFCHAMRSDDYAPAPA